MLWVLLIVLAVAAGAGWYSQEQRVQALEGQLEEADYWARQSKLALARFEGELSETGENLQERGASLEDQLAANKKRLDTADSEIRKLWAIANERNKKRLDEQQERIAALESGLAEGKKSIGALETSVEKVRSSLSADIAALKQQTETSITALQDANRQATDQLTKLSQQLADVDQVIESRIRRFEQEQKLGISGMEGRISALERETDELAGDGRVQALRNDVASLKRTVESIDASRSQLTSRLVRLSEEVNQLRSQVSGQ
jgi:peptidoglycan hydrolase CwlO-like protein